MTELDFDELDKAVNSLMADVSTTPDASTPVSKPTDSSSTATPVSSESTPKVDSKPAAPSLATKRRGQFMDIVRPGGSKPTTAAAPALGRRQGVTIAPSPDVSIPSDAAVDTSSTSSAESSSVVSAESTSGVTAPVAMSEVEPATQPEAASTSTPSTTKSDWPDPIDFANSETQKSDDSESVSASTEETTAPTEGVAPLESPFLPDAKPEKRPLGLLATSETEASEQAPIDESASSAVATPPSAPLPAELHGNVVAIESESTGQSTTPAAEQPEATASTKPSTQAEPETKPIEQPVDTPAGGSIPQQYKEAPNTGDQTNGSIYDTANYHKAIEAHATGGKHGSVVKIVIWAVLLLVVGAGAGAALFMFTR